MNYLSQIIEQSELSELRNRHQHEGLASEHSAPQQNMSSNFSNDQIQINDSLLTKPYDTPTTPANYHFGRISSLSRNINSNSINQIFPPHVFSPTPRYLNPLSPEQNHYFSGPMIESAINQSVYNHNPINYPDLEEFHHRTPLPSSHLYNNNLIQSNYSYRNTPIPISPHMPIMQSGGGRILSSHYPDNCQFTPLYMQNNINSNNNLFNQSYLTQTPQNQSPLQNLGGIRCDIDNVDNQGQESQENDDPFGEGNNLAFHFANRRRDDDQDDIQQYESRQKKLKVEEKEQNQRNQEDDNADQNSYTEINPMNGIYGELDKKEENLNQEQNFNNNTVITRKQNFNISPENQKYQNTPLKNNFDNQSFMTPNNQNFMTPNNQQNPNTQIDTNLQTQTQKQKNAPYNNSNLFQNNQFEIPSNQRQKINRIANQKQTNGNCTAQNDGNDSDDENNGNRNERGLRILSKEVLEIVREKNETTYKEVTDEIIQNRKKNNQKQVQEEQNIKRRVYDALNVLIAAELITKSKKQNKVIQYNKPLNGICSNIQKIPVSKNSKEGINNVVSNNQLEKQQNQKTYLKNSLDSKKDRLKRKHEILKDLTLKMLASKHLIKRNVQNELIKMKEEQNVKLGNSASSKDSTQTLKCISLSKGASTNGEEQIKLKFPFIACQSPPDNSKMSFKKFTSGLAICSMKQLKLKGDIDLLVQIYEMDTNTNKGNDIQEFLDPELYQFLNEVQSKLYDEEVKLEQEFTVSNNKHIQQIVQNSIHNQQTQDIQKSRQYQAKDQLIHNIKNEDEENSSQITTNQLNDARNDLENQHTNQTYQVIQGSEIHQNCDEYENYIN
ncbi:transcription factor e2f/dimerization partner (macronuclear) [Tetrahymena thermophila SB210]|uniref:Transcription factor e2f/dimerization partner n=1 Tax=Tetrahymena thermophila (strain SB210) TaxID=312017 RepID=Q234A4_TETTS|nr:transcription factor e2f/dimerization partner [Tetrahymena thermophila SB210]EAR92098.3 transcription factor e2f/dimerization partner [Tetrahymena thermophila SB210]|eukprot:XP_001012344.3 transcription factor e2f/dimerization partner [Tetrahymena thermophila SB210]